MIASTPGAVVSCAADSPVEALMRERGFDVEPTPFRPMVRRAPGRSLVGAVRAARDLRGVLARHPDQAVVYATSARAGLQCTLAAAGMGRTLVWGLWDPTPGPPLGSAVRAAALGGCDLAIACSEWTARSFAGRSRRLRARTRVVHPGIRTERFESASADPGAPRALAIGSLIPEKRLEVAVETAALVRAEEPRFALRVAGRPQYHEANRAYAQDLAQRAGEEVEFTGHVDDVPAFMEGAGMLLHSRSDEPFATVLMEAMAAGLPIVAPASGGTPELVRHEVEGLLYEPGSARAAAAATLRLIRDRALAARLGAAGRERVRSYFGLDAWLARQRDALRAVT